MNLTRHFFAVLFVGLLGIGLCILSPSSASAQAQPFKFLEFSGSFRNGAEASLLSTSPTRFRIDLEGMWDYTLEGGVTGTVSVPSAYDFSGRVTFRRTFTGPDSSQQAYRYHLVAFGINNSSEVTVNNDMVSSHSGGFTSVPRLIPQNTVQPGKDNVITVAVSNELDAKHTIPLRPRVWEPRNYGGIMRDIYILATPQVYVREAVITSELMEKGGGARVSVKAMINGQDTSAATLGFYVELYDKISGLSGGKSPLATFAKPGAEDHEVHVDVLLPSVKLWNPDAPELYMVKCYLVRVRAKQQTEIIDELDQNYGIRTIGIAGGNILLNGKRLVLKGVLWNEESARAGGVMTYEERERDIAMIKALGANVIRFGNHPPHPYMLDLCDRYGLLAMEELGLRGTPGPVLEDESYVDQAGTLLQELIARDRNHPSVLAWGLGDEFDVMSTSSRHSVEGLVRLAKSLDSRPTYFGGLPLDQDVCSDLVDLAVVNIHTQDLKEFRKQMEEWRGRHPNQPVVLGKFGTQVEQTNRKGSSDPLSQEAQARFFLQRLEVARSLDFDGAIVWAFNDWRGERPALSVSTGSPWVYSLGLVNADREKRLAFDAVRAVFHGEKMSALPVGSYSSSAPIIYVLVGFVVLVLVAYIYNANRRFRDNLNRSLLSSFNFYSDVRDAHSVPVLHTTVLGLTISIAAALVISSILYHFRDNLVLDNLLSFLLVSDKLKAAAARLIRRPLEFIGIFSLILFVGLVLLGGVVHAASVFVRTRVYPFHAYTVTLWSVAPLLFFIPVGMILYRVMESEVYVIPALVVVAALLIWAFLRLLKGMAIIFDVLPLKMYMLGVFAVIVVLGVGFAFYDYAMSAPMYIHAAYKASMHSL